MNKNTKIIWKAIDELIPYEHNAKEHTEKQLANLEESFRRYGWQQPCLITNDDVIITGHGRALGAKRAGLTDAPCIYCDDLSEKEIKEYRHLDNLLSDGDYIQSELEFELPELDFSGFDLEFDVDLELPEKQKEPDDVEHITLTDKFIVPPFSILDTRQGYWQDRKKAWKNLGLKSDLGRNPNLSNAQDKADYMKTGCKGVAVQTSIFDPVLCEIVYRWFCTDGGKIYDCFAGGSVRGIVADKLGYEYTGIELRKEQVEANNENAKEIGIDPCWICDDSLNADKYIDDDSVDLIFSCPPYADLEVYSDDERDISNMDYSDFCKSYKEIIDIACRKLKDNRFAVFVVGDVRDKKGAYRDFVDWTKKCFLKNGLKTYNELILLEQSGTGALRAKKQFGSLRKVIKTHQNVLVFYKGDIKKIKENYKEIIIDDNSFEEYVEKIVQKND